MLAGLSGEKGGSFQKEKTAYARDLRQEGALHILVPE